MPHLSIFQILNYALLISINLKYAIDFTTNKYKKKGVKRCSLSSICVIYKRQYRKLQ